MYILPLLIHTPMRDLNNLHTIYGDNQNTISKYTFIDKL